MKIEEIIKSNHRKKSCDNGHVLRNFPTHQQDFSNIQSADAPIFENSIIHLPRFVDSEELAATLGVSVHTIRKWRSQGRIKPKKFGRSVRYVVAEVVAALIK
jgi:excisionase family DNA binding protein